MRHHFVAEGWWYLRGHGWVASIAGIPGLDPLTLRGQRVVIDGQEYTCTGVETGLLLDDTGTPFGLLVGGSR